ncbi:hypothetical protein OESDEN_08866 [Oesophagostomum dentatum]|uniref:Uncharacterized protein n=1 Tax=Oesophagostomum dentatum TaxID=61180 RepID=A0A0B1T7A6_OESDE|nr:hypothetical protein OESDEN_08866 [Oesophagostomum dentatum]
MYNLFGDGEFFPNSVFASAMADILCDKTVNKLCEDFIFSVVGPNSNQFNMSRLGIYMAHDPAGTSSRNMLHFAQMINTKRFAPFDQGVDGNLRWYGTTYPPEYDMRAVHSDIYLFYSDYDWLATAEDVEEYLIPNLPTTSLKLARRLQGFNHNDFVWGLRARSEIYDPIANFIKVDSWKLYVHRNMTS